MRRLSVRQKTLKTAISCTGTGLHSGQRVTMTLRPAEPGSGVVFRRTDLLRAQTAPRSPDIRADWRHVTDTRLCTLVANEDGATLGTIEHLMAALFGAEIDNLLIEIDGPEVPVMDGSAAPFLFLIDCAGVVEQEAPRRAIEIVERVSIEDGKKSLTLLPGAGFSVGFEIDFDNEVIQRQSRWFAMTTRAFRNDVARARTFGFAHEVAQLRAAGLARGGSLDNAVVISGDRVLNQGGLRFDDEFVRHKVLDLVGDLYLAGAPLIGQVRAVRSGHRHNNDILHALFARPSAWRYVELTEAELAPATSPRREQAGVSFPAAGD